MQRKYANASEKQKAYLQRKEAHRQLTVDARILELETKLAQALAEIEVLKNPAHRHAKRGEGGIRGGVEFLGDNAPSEKKSKKEKNEFKAPSLEEIKEYCNERAQRGKPKTDPEEFFAFYTARAWMIKNTKIKNWKACVWTWERNASKNAPRDNGFQGVPEEYR